MQMDKKKLLIIGGCGAVVLVILVAALWKLLGGDKEAGKKTTGAETSAVTTPIKSALNNPAAKEGAKSAKEVYFAPTTTQGASPEITREVIVAEKAAETSASPKTTTGKEKNPYGIFPNISHLK